MNSRALLPFTQHFSYRLRTAWPVCKSWWSCQLHASDLWEKQTDIRRISNPSLPGFPRSLPNPRVGLGPEDWGVQCLGRQGDTASSSVRGRIEEDGHVTGSAVEGLEGRQGPSTSRRGFPVPRSRESSSRWVGWTGCGLGRMVRIGRIGCLSHPPHHFRSHCQTSADGDCCCWVAPRLLQYYLLTVRSTAGTVTADDAVSWPLGLPRGWRGAINRANEVGAWHLLLPAWTLLCKAVGRCRLAGEPRASQATVPQDGKIGRWEATRGWISSPVAETKQRASGKAWRGEWLASWTFTRWWSALGKRCPSGSRGSACSSFTGSIIKLNVMTYSTVPAQ